MSRGAARKLDWPSLSLAMDEILLQLEIDEIWLEDLYPKVIDRYQKISSHNVISKNSYPIARFSAAFTKEAFSKRGWAVKQRRKRILLSCEEVVYRTKNKAFRIGEEE